jgi:hypothetical protein
MTIAEIRFPSHFAYKTESTSSEMSVRAGSVNHGAAVTPSLHMIEHWSNISCTSDKLTENCLTDREYGARALRLR